MDLVEELHICCALEAELHTHTFSKKRKLRFGGTEFADGHWIAPLESALKS